MDEILITVTIFRVNLKFAGYTGYNSSYMDGYTPPSPLGVYQSLVYSIDAGTYQLLHFISQILLKSKLKFIDKKF